MVETTVKSKKRHKEKAGVVVHRHADSGDLVFLVVSARKFKNQWVFPVGTLEKGESLEAAAKRECEEESGYQVKIGEKLPSVRYEGNNIVKRFTFFLATVVGETDQWERDRVRKWMPASQVVTALPDIFQGVARSAVRRIS